MTAAPVVVVERHEAVALVRLNRPEARNAMSLALCAALVEGIEQCQDARAIVLTGTDPAFCAGVDLKELAAIGLVETGPNVMAALRDSSVPVIGAINGPCMTGGLELALACDFLIGSERALFADTHARVGVYPGGGMTVALPRRVGTAFAKQMSLTGNFVDAETALRVGLLNALVPHADLVPTALGLANDIASVDPQLAEAVRRGIEEAEGIPGDAAFDAEERIARRMHTSLTTGELGRNAAAVMARSRERRGS